MFEGMHTRLADSKDHIGERLAERCTNIFWTIYILDRNLSSTIGVPPSLHDADIRNVLPSPDSAPQRIAVLSLHVKFSRLISRILSGKPSLFARKSTNMACIGLKHCGANILERTM